MGQEFYSFNEVLRELQIERDQLERLMEEGEVKAFREGDKIKFLKEDIELLKSTKMDQPTITVHSDKEADAVLIEEIVEDDEQGRDNAEESAKEEDEEVAPKPLFAMGEEGEIDAESQLESEPEPTPAPQEKNKQTGFMRLGEKQSGKDKNKKPAIVQDQPAETKSLLSLPEDANAQQPLLDIYHHSKERTPKNYEAIKADTEELVFERESGDDLLETGELLFESKDQVLPRDKEMAELFTDSEMNISPYDSRDQAIEEAWDLSENTGEDIVSSESSANNNGTLAIDESKRRKKVKSFGTVAAGALAFIVLAFFILFPKQQTEMMNVKVKLYQVEEKSVARDRQVEGTLPSVQTMTVAANAPGKIVELLPVGTQIKAGMPLATLLQEVPLKQQIAEMEKQLAAHKENLAAVLQHKNVIANASKASANYQSLKKQYEAAKKPEEKSKYEKDYKKAYSQFQTDLQEYGKLKKIYEKALPTDITKQRAALTALLVDKETQLIKQSQELENDIAEKSKEEPVKRIAIAATQQGIIRRWLTEQDNQIVVDQPLVQIALVQAEFIMPEAEAIDWKTGEAIKLKWEDSVLTGTIDKIYQDRGTSPVTLRIIALVNPAEQELRQGSKIVLQYQKQYQGILEVPREAILQEPQGNFIFKMKEENKIYKCEVRPEKSETNFVLVTGDIFNGDRIVRQIVSPKNKQIKDLQNGLTVTVQKD